MNIPDWSGVLDEVFGQRISNSGDPLDVQALLHLRRLRQPADETCSGADHRKRLPSSLTGKTS